MKTRYSFSVDALRLDGSNTIGASHSFTTFGTSPAATFGKPAIDQDTFGFSYWDRLALDSQRRYPSDCLFVLRAGDIPTVCFSPATRELRFVNVGRRGSEIYWSFNLPGTNQANSAEGLVWYASNEFAIVADTRLAFATSNYELSGFRRTGEFISTLPVLQSFTASGTNSNHQLNIDGKDLIIDIGQVRSGGPSVVDQYTSIQVIGEYYEPIAGGDTTQPSGWDNAGAFIAQIDAQTGDTLEYWISCWVIC